MNIKSDLLLANKIIRPYDGLENFESIFDAMELEVNHSASWKNEEEVVFKFEDYVDPKIRVRFCSEKENWVKQITSAAKNIQVSLDEIFLFGLIRRSGTKETREFITLSLSELVSTDKYDLFEVPLNESPRILQNQETSLEFYLLLGKNNENKFPLPYLKGTWLTQKIFKIRSEAKGTLEFDWINLDEDKRNELNLHRNSIQYVETIYPLHQGESFSDCIKAYLDSDYKTKLETLENKNLQKFLIADLVCEVLTISITHTFLILKNENTSWVQIENQGILTRILQAIASKGSYFGKKIDADEIYQKFIDEPERISEFIQDYFKVRNYALAFTFQNGDE